MGSPLRVGELCAGYGGLGMAVMDVLDAEVAWHCQYDPDDKHQYAARILDAHWPDVPNHGDITAIDWNELRRTLMADRRRDGSVHKCGKEDHEEVVPNESPAVDILTAGFPIGHANPSATPASEKEPTTSGGCGPMSQKQFAYFDRDSCSWRTSAPSLFEDSTPSPIRWPRSGTTSRGRAFALPTWGGHTVASAGSALLGTPMTTSGCGPGDLTNPRNRTRLETQAVLLPTPRASENENRQTHRTPSQIAGTHGKNLAAEVCELLPTPKASDGTKGGPNQRGSSGDLTLPSAAVQLLPTPTTQAHSRNSTANRRDPKPTTNTESSTLLDVFWTGEPTDPPSTDGST